MRTVPVIQGPFLLKDPNNTNLSELAKPDPNPGCGLEGPTGDVMIPCKAEAAVRHRISKLPQLTFTGIGRLIRPMLWEELWEDMRRVAEALTMELPPCGGPRPAC